MDILEERSRPAQPTTETDLSQTMPKSSVRRQVHNPPDQEPLRALQPETAPAPSYSAEYRKFLAISKFESLDGLRCFSILAVMWHHATEAGKGFLGVEVFFAISGFLITTLLLRERRKYGEISLGKFYARRSLRIFPLYYAVLLVYVALVFATQRHVPAGRDFFHNLPFFATDTSNWFVPLNGRVIFYFSWSLATEEQFYLVIPSLEKYLRNWAVPALLLAIGLHLAAQFFPLGIVIAKISLLLCLGVLAAHALDNPNSFRYIAAITYPKICSLFWLVAVIVLAWFNANEVFLGPAMALLVVSSVIRRDHALAWLFNWEPFQAIGRVSYGMYMLHQLCFTVLKRIFPFPPPADLFAVGAVLTFLVASASFRWYESIFLRMKKNYAH
jgi:peptidoglycan/LPS O-acetylase OafA/YrhL